MWACAGIWHRSAIPAADSGAGGCLFTARHVLRQVTRTFDDVTGPNNGGLCHRASGRAERVLSGAGGTEGLKG